MALNTIEKSAVKSAAAYTLHKYDHKFDARLARMWNESDDQWPGTFTDGVPLTEKRVAEWMDRVDAIIQFIVVEDATDKVVGYGDLWDTPVRPGSCYVALLNVHPAHQGQSLARRMLVHMVDWAVENNYDRITIGTWPANLKAMPLYKKVGFFWTPDTNVLMENYLPAVRLLPATQGYFAHHDWYRTYDRSLKQVEDKMRHPETGETKVYILRWEEDGDLIEAVFDRHSHSLTGLETNDWAVYASAGESNPGKGITYPFKWVLINKTNRPLEISLTTESAEGIEIEQTSNITLSPEERKVIHKNFRVATDAPKYRIDHEDVPTPKITTNLTINDQTVELGTGLKYRPTVEFSTHPEAVSLLPGIPQTVHLQLQNRVKRALSGTVNLECPAGLTLDTTSHQVNIEAEGHAGVPITLTAELGGYFPLKANIAFEDAGETITTKAKLLPVMAITPGGWAAGEGDEELILENDLFRITCKAKSGSTYIWNKDLQRRDVRITEELGPAFIPNDLYEQEYDLLLQKVDGGAKAIMTVRSTRFPGMVVGREIKMTASPLIRMRSWAANNSEETQKGLQIRPMFNAWRNEGRKITVPLDGRIVHEPASEFGSTDGDLPEKLDRYDERWVSWEQDGRVNGVIWPENGVSKVQGNWGRFNAYVALPVLEPGKVEYTEPFYIYDGPGSWHTVRQTYRRLQKPASRRIPDEPVVPAVSHLDIHFNPDPLVTIDDEITAQLTAHTTREYKLTGQMTIHPPKGWEADLSQVEIIDVDYKSAAKESISFRGAASRVGAASGVVRLETQAIDALKPFEIIRIGKRTMPVEVSKSKKLGHDIWQIANGRSAWEIAPNFNASVISWIETQEPVNSKKPETNHLLTAFPEDGELSWIKPWYGGISPTLHDPGNEEGWPGKLQEESFEGILLEAADGCGLLWKGVRLTAELTRETFRGLHAEIEYLTLGGSNVLKIVYRLINETGVYRDAEPGLMAFLQVDGTHKNAVLHTKDYHRKRTPVMSWGIGGHWAAAQNPETGRTLAVVNATGWQRVQSMDWGNDGAHFNLYEITRVPPAGTFELTAYLALAESLDEAKRYGVLKDLKGKK